MSFSFVLSLWKCKLTSCNSKNAAGSRPLRFALWKRPLTGLLQHTNLISWGMIYFYSYLSILKNVIASGHCVEGCSHVCACDRVPVHSVFKADPIKQTEPGHGRIAWKRVGEGWRGMERMGRDGARGHEGRNTMGERAQPESQGEIKSGRMVEGTERLRGRGQRCHANVWTQGLKYMEITFRTIF